MKSLVYAVIAATALSASAVAMAQGSEAAGANNQPLTRAQVRAELVALENAGYRPGLSDPNYPDDVQAAEARIHAGATSYGPQTAAVTEAGGPAAANVRPPAHGSIYGGGR